MFETVGNISDKLQPFIQPMDTTQGYISHPDYYGFYFAIGRDVRPDGIIEIGVRFGYSAISMLLGSNQNTSYIGFDCECYVDGSNKIALDNINQVTKGAVVVNNVDTQKIDCEQFSDMIPSWFMPHIIHVDGAHDVEGMIHDLNLADHVAIDGTYILVDDTDSKPHADLGPACKKWAEDKGYGWEQCHTLMGLTVIKKTVA